MRKSIFDKLVDKSISLVELPNCQQKHFSFILRKNKLISMGWNNGWKTDPLAKKFGHRFSSIHSELAAIKNMPYPVSFLEKCRMINIRINKQGELRLSKPCQYCSQMLSTFGLKELWYSNNLGEFIEY